MYIKKFVGLIGVHIDSPRAAEILLCFPPSPSQTDGEANRENLHYYTCSAGGLQIGWDRNRIVRSVFLFGSRRDVFMPFQGELWEGCTVDSGRAEVIAAFGQPVKSGNDYHGFLSTVTSEWFRYTFGTVTVHFQFRDGADGIELITIAEAAPPGNRGET